MVAAPADRRGQPALRGARPGASSAACCALVAASLTDRPGGSVTWRRISAQQALTASRESRPGPLQDLPRHGGRGRQDLPHAAGGPGGGRRRARRRDRLSGAARTGGDHRSGRGPGGGAAAQRSSIAARRSRRWTCPPSCAAHPELALIDELAHTNAPGARAREALRGHRGRARGGHRRLLDRQRPAPRVPQRPGRRADRGAGARDGSRLGARDGRRGGADRPHPARR